MNRFYCPYCSAPSQSNEKDINGVMVCGNCGDPMIKAPLISSVQIFSLIIVTAFIAPMITLSLYLLQDQKNYNNQTSLTLGSYMRQYYDL